MSRLLATDRDHSLLDLPCLVRIGCQQRQVADLADLPGQPLGVLEDRIEGVLLEGEGIVLRALATCQR